MIYKRHAILTETNEVRFYFNNQEFHAIRYNRYSVFTTFSNSKHIFYDYDI